MNLLVAVLTEERRRWCCMRLRSPFIQVPLLICLVIKHGFEGKENEAHSPSSELLNLNWMALWKTNERYSPRRTNPFIAILSLLMWLMCTLSSLRSAVYIISSNLKNLFTLIGHQIRQCVEPFTTPSIDVACTMAMTSEPSKLNHWIITTSKDVVNKLASKCGEETNSNYQATRNQNIAVLRKASSRA